MYVYGLSNCASVRIGGSGMGNGCSLIPDSILADAGYQWDFGLAVVCGAVDEVGVTLVWYVTRY